jgi:hypothetical protein
MTRARPRLIVNCAANDLTLFRRVAEAATALAERYDVRMVVSHLSRRDLRQLTDPDDPYLQYSVNFPSLFSFVVPPAVEPFVDRDFAEANRSLLDAKLAVLRQLGLKAAFFGREPVFFREPLFEQHPRWRGPRVDHPRRSRNPVYSLCLHQPEVQTLYRQAVEELVGRFPELDTFYWWTNDSGSGFCWYPYLYAGPNGPEHCRDLGPVEATAAFQSAVLDGARAAGVDDPMSVMLHTRIWDEGRMPSGAFVHPSDRPQRDVVSMGADLSLTYPVRYLWDPLRRLGEIGALSEPRPAAVVCWLSDVYHRASPDPGTAERFFALWALADRDPSATRRLASRLALLNDLATSAFGPGAAEDAVEGWVKLHEAFTLQRNSPYLRPLIQYLPTYGPVSHRWLTRPLVAFPEALTVEEERYFLPHVFAVGEPARRGNLLDVHGYPAAAPGESYDLRSRYFDRIASLLGAAASSFERAAGAAAGQARCDLAATGRAARLMACLWATCRNWIEFAALRTLESSRSAGETARPHDTWSREAEEHRQRLFRVLRREIDNSLTFQELLGSDPEMVVVRGSTADDEDTFTLGPDLSAQLTRKRSIMLAHWQDVASPELFRG